MAATKQRVLQHRVPAGLRLRSSSYPYRSACIMSSAVAALLLCTPTSGFMPTKSHHAAPPMLRQASVQGPKSPVWSLGQLVRGYASRVGGRRVQPLNLKGTVSSRDASTAAANLIQTPSYQNEDLLVKHPKLISGSLPNGRALPKRHDHSRCDLVFSMLPPLFVADVALEMCDSTHSPRRRPFFSRCRVQILHLQQQEASVPLLRESRGARWERR